MRLLPSLLVAMIALAGPLFAQNNDPITLVGSIPSKSIVQPVASPAIDLRSYFDVPTLAGKQVVQFNTRGLPGGGIFNVVMDSVNAPNTVANFLAYANAGSFTNSLIHRSNPNYRIIQGGGFVNNNTFLSYIGTVAPVAMETSASMVHERGTIAMARSDYYQSGFTLDTATSQWFINTADNTGTWDPASANTPNSYAAFGRVTGTGMTVVDAIAALPVPSGVLTVSSSATNSKFVTVNTSTLPAGFGAGWGLLGSNVNSIVGSFVTLQDNANQNISTATPVAWQRLSAPLNELPVLSPLPADNTLFYSNLVTENSISVVPLFPATAGGAAVVTFSATSSNPGLVNVSISGSNLSVAAAANLTGAATVTVTATDSNGNSVQSQFNVSVTRKVLDYNSDGHADLLLQNGSGQVVLWRMNGNAGVASSAYLYSGGLGDWYLAATADIDANGTSDLIFQNTIGQIAVWRMNSNGSIASSTYLSSSGLGEWKIVGTADLNRDGYPDVVFQNNSNQIFVWYLNASGAVAASGYLYSGGLGDWRVRGLADVNSDGRPDLIFQNTSGQIVVWYLSSTGAVTSSAYISSSGLGEWKIVSIADMNGDGKADLILQNTAGQTLVWYLNGNGVVSGSAWISSSGLGDWRVR